MLSYEFIYHILNMIIENVLNNFKSLTTFFIIFNCFIMLYFLEWQHAFLISYSEAQYYSEYLKV